MRGSATKVRWVAPIAVAGTLAVSGCGGDDPQAQEPASQGQAYRIQVVTASFPARQQLAKATTLRITVRNADTRTIPNVAVSLAGITTRNEQPEIADPRSPVWIVDDSPRAGVTAYVDTWALGPLRPAQEQEYVWRLTPVVPGRHTVSWRVAGDLTGSAKAALADGGTPEGSFEVRVSPSVRDPGERLPTGTAAQPAG